MRAALLRRLSVAVGLVFLLGMLWSPITGALAQDKSKAGKKPGKTAKAKPQANTRNLDLRADQSQSAFVKETASLADEYLEAGHVDKARALLKSLVQMNPDLTDVQKKLEQVEESILNANDTVIEVNPSKGWEPAGVSVFEGRPIRFQVEGSYRLDVGQSVSGAGLPSKDSARDVVANIPCGALMGIIVVNGKPGDPFPIGEGRDFTPKETGILALRVNAPAGNKNTGKLKVSISGWVKGQ